MAIKGAIRSSRPKLLILCTLALVVAGTVWIASGRGGAAHASNLPAVTQSDYSALAASTAGDASSSVPAHATSGEGDHPVAGSITEVAVKPPNLSVMISKSSEGGVCIFLERHGAKGAGTTCSPAALLRTGATAELHEGANDEITIAGVVPDDVSTVQVTFADGTSRAVSVVNNVWAIEAAPAAMSSANDVTGG